MFVKFYAAIATDALGCLFNQSQETSRRSHLSEHCYRLSLVPFSCIRLGAQTPRFLPNLLLDPERRNGGCGVPA